jgi:hypothetical protein
MVKGVTSSGFEFEIPDGVKNDFRFIKAYRDLKSADEDKQADGALALVSATFCDAEQEGRFYDHLAAEHEGRVPIDILYAELSEIIRIASESEDKALKNT